MLSFILFLYLKVVVIHLSLFGYVCTSLCVFIFLLLFCVRCLRLLYLVFFACWLTRYVWVCRFFHFFNDFFLFSSWKNWGKVLVNWGTATDRCFDLRGFFFFFSLYTACNFSCVFYSLWWFHEHVRVSVNTLHLVISRHIMFGF